MICLEVMMKGEVWFVVAGLVLSLGFGILMMQDSFFTGYAVLDEEVLNEEIFTREDVLQALNESHEIVDEMKVAGFSGVLVGDLLVESEKIFQQVEYAEVLRGNVNASVEEKREARDALEFVDWRFINYSNVLEYTGEIVEVRELAFFVQDLLLLQESFLGAERDESGEIVSFTAVEDVYLERFKFLINEIENAIGEARYDEANVLAEELKEEVDIRRTEVFTALVLARGFWNFVVKYWYFSLLVLAVFVFGGYYFSKGIRRRILKGRIRRLRVEEKVILALMKKTQVERFKENKISGLVYNIRMKKFEEKKNSIKEDLPVLEKRLAGRTGGVKKKKKGEGSVSTVARRLVGKWVDKN